MSELVGVAFVSTRCVNHPEGDHEGRPYDCNLLIGSNDLQVLAHQNIVPAAVGQVDAVYHGVAIFKGFFQDNA